MTDTLYIGMGYLAAGIGIGMVLLGAGLGIGKLTAAALDGTARQPEAGNDIRGMMILGAALIEGLGLLGLIFCFLIIMNFAKPQAAAPAAAPQAQTTQAQH